MELTKRCTVCGNEFTPKVHNAKYCSDKCRKTARNERVTQWQREHRLETNEGARRRWEKKKIQACAEAHDNCFACDTLDGECRFD